MSFAGARLQMNTILYQNRPGETWNWTNLNLEPNAYRIYYVNIDLRHQYQHPPCETSSAARCEEKRLLSHASNCAASPPSPPTNISSPLPPIFHFRAPAPAYSQTFFFLIPRAVAGKCAWSWVMRMHETVRRWPHNACEVLIVFLNWKPSIKQTEHHSAWASASQSLPDLCAKKPQFRLNIRWKR